MNTVTRCLAPLGWWEEKARKLLEYDSNESNHGGRMAPLKNHALAVAVGLILGFVMVWWVRPDTSAGAVFLVFATTTFCFVAGSILQLIGNSVRGKGP